MLHRIREGRKGRLRQPGYRPTSAPRFVASHIAHGLRGRRTGYLSCVFNMSTSFLALRSRRFALALVPASVLSFLAPAAAQPTETLRPVVVTGTVVPRTLGSEVAATSVLTREDLARSGVRDLVSALGLVGTALVEQQGGPGTAAFVRLRGADSRDTLLLVDGVPLTDVTAGLAPLAQVPADIIERIEIVRGNLSALYGANATGGVIHVFTRRGTEGTSAQARVGFGSRATRWANASIAGGSETLRGRLTLGAERSDGYSAIDPASRPLANPDDDGNHRRNAALAVDATVAKGHTLGLDLRVLSDRVDYDSEFAAPADVHHGYVLQHGAALRGRHELSAGWSLDWRAGEAEERRRNTAVTAMGESITSNVVHSRIAAVDLNGSPVADWAVQFGAERVSQSTDGTSYTQTRRSTNVLRAGLSHDAAWGSLQANVRHDDTSDFGSATTGLLGGLWRIGGGFSAIANVSTSFTPPTFDFLYYDCLPFGFVCSNPNLVPERARNREIGLQWGDDDTLVRLTAFAARYRDKIANDASFIPQNLARARNDGAELTARTRLGAWRLSGEAVLHDPVDEATGARLLRRAGKQMSLRADYIAPTWSIGGTLRHVGERPDVGNVVLPSYTLLDLGARWRFAPQWELQATLDNVFDRAYQPTAGYNGRQRGLFVSVGWRMER